MSEILLDRTSRHLLVGYGWLVLAFVMAPIVILIPMSFSGEQALVFPPALFSLRWYATLFSDSRWRDAAFLSLLVALCAASIATATGTMAALAISRIGPRWSWLFKLLFLSPMIVPLMVIGAGLYIVFGKMRLLGSFASLVFAHTALTIPFAILPVSARLAALNPWLERAAAVCGAGQTRTIAHIILPLLVPAAAAGFAFAFVFSFDEVVVAQFLSGPSLETLPRRMWEGIAVGGLDKTITAISTVEIGIALLATMLLSAWRRWPNRVGINHLFASRRRSVDAPAPQIANPQRYEGQPSGVRVVCERLAKRFVGTAAVEGFDLTIEAGEFVAILGPSGSGKTTLLMLVAGFLSPNSGRILLDGRDVSSVPPHRRDIGVVFQNYALFPHLDVRRNVAFPLTARKMAQAEVRRRTDWALSLIRMESFGERRISELSGGQQQRVALARAIAFDPCALLMDEPLSALDKSLRLDMQAEIRRLQRSLGQTVIYVTHDQEEAINLADRVAVMRDGKLQQVATPKDLYFKPRNAFVASFFGEANLFCGVADGTNLTTAEGAKLPLPSPFMGPATLCVRPEIIAIGQGAADFPAIDAIVEEIRFQGSVIRVRLATALGPVTVTRQFTAAEAPPEPGAVVKITWQRQLSQIMEAS
jgi:ABC-type Fe3+/spermidine/putrescine transport system ATPase subunit/ABC-type spermidine/putrescine transport system permease subunit II